MAELLLQFITTYGDLAIGIIAFVEGLGLPLPSETALLLGAALAGHGDLSITSVLTAAIAGAAGGGVAGYWIGRLGGNALLHRHGPRVMLTRERIDRTHALLERHGASAIIIARFIAFVRIVVSFAAGAAKMPFGYFFVYNLIGAIAWGLSFGALGHAFGSDLPRLERWLRAFGIVLVIAIGVAALYFLWRHIRRKRKQ